MVPVNHMKLCRDVTRTLLDDFNGSRRLRSCETGRASFYDATLVPRDFLNHVSQHGRVIDSQARNASDCRLDQDVCAIVLPANAAFDYCGIDAFAQVCMVCHQSQEPEVARLRSCIWRLAFRPCCVLQSIPCLEEISCKDFF